MNLSEELIDKTIPVPMYFQLKQLILTNIKNGTCPYGSMIPTENEFIDKLHISRTTVRQAITELVQEGWLYRIKSKGTFVSKPKLQHDFVSKIEPFNDQIKRLGKQPSTEVLAFTAEKATEQVAKSLNLHTGDPVIFLHRRRFADEEAIVTLRTYLPYERCKFLLNENMVTSSLYNLLDKNRETSIHWIRRRIEAVEATAYDVKYLHVKYGKSIQLFSSIGYNYNDEPIEYSVARYRGDMNMFELSIIRK